MQKVKIGVIGVGHLGSIHARLYKEIPECSLEAVCDTDTGRLKEVSEGLGVTAAADYRELFGKVDAVSIATPTRQHYALCAEMLSHDIHCLVEKPFTENIPQANRLIRISRARKRTLQVGHVERFNSAFEATRRIIHEPRFIECHRLSPFPNRSLDIGVVLDLMIHDIDIVLGLVSSPVKRIEATGVNVLTSFEDIANARLTFKNGCVANLTASRVSDEVMRKIRIFQENTYISLDYKEARARRYTKEKDTITKEDLPIEKEQPLRKELESFVRCVASGTEPLVSGEAGRDALSVALRIQKSIWRS
ncbi:MAG: Gfo/Idh/MocA family oxidoreductase [Candidatus Omnitrophica bacterium]|nr:Gfo/Idh/MocA family oxidoreductase [Candidatus Omnitrophota bacterium]